MLRLHGYPVSNYVNIVRAALIEKALDFEFSIVRASGDATVLLLNPMGKVPVLETDEGMIGETVAILGYLDDRYAERSLLPEGPFERARARQIVNIAQMYVEAPARSLFPGVFGGGENGAPTETAVRAVLERAAGALAALMRPAPFLFGEGISQADLFAFYNLDIADRVTRFVYDWSVVDAIGTIGPWFDAMKRRDSTRTVLTDFERYFAQYLSDHGAAYQSPGHMIHA